MAKLYDIYLVEEGVRYDVIPNQYLYEPCGLELSEAFNRAEWLNDNIRPPALVYCIQERDYQPLTIDIKDPSFDEPEHDPFWTGEEEPYVSEWLSKVPESCYEKNPPMSPRLVWPPLEGYDAEELYDQTFVSLDEMQAETEAYESRDDEEWSINWDDDEG